MNIFNKLIDIIIINIENFGYFWVLLAVFLEYACVPLPSEILLPFIGLLASRGNFNFLLVILITIIGGLVGSSLCYILGFYLGSPIINWLSKKSSGAKKSFSKLDEILLKHGKFAVFLSRLVPLTRTYISLLVGSMKMNYFQFLTYSLGGIALWNIGLLSLGYFLGENTNLIKVILREYSVIVIIIIATLGIFFSYKLYKNKKKSKNL